MTLATSAVMCVAFLEFQLCTALLGLIHSLTLHCLIKIYQMTVKLRSIYTGELDLVANLQTACCGIAFIIVVMCFLMKRK